MVTVVTGKELQGTGVWGFVKADGSATNRAVIAATIVALVVVFNSPSLVAALTTDSSINSM